MRRHTHRVGHLRGVLRNNGVGLADIISRIANCDSEELLSQLLRDSRPVARSMVSKLIRADLTNGSGRLRATLSNLLSRLRGRLLVGMLSRVSSVDEHVTSLSSFYQGRVGGCRSTLSGLSRVPNVTHHATRAVLVRAKLSVSEFPATGRFTH